MPSYRKIGKHWHYRFVNENGKQVSRKGCPDRRETERMALAAETEVAKLHAGLIDRSEVSRRDHERTSIVDHLASWRSALEVKGGTAKHVELFSRRAERVLSEAGIVRISDLSVAKVQAALSAMGKAGLSFGTLNHHRNAVRSFSRWLARDGRISTDALAGVTGYNAATDPRHERRTVSQAELATLIRAAHEGPPYRGISGPARSIVYRLAVASGLRYAELQSLTWRSFNLNAERPTVTILAGYAKNGATATLPLARDLADDLQAYLASRPADGPAFELPARGADMLRVDLSAAGIPYRDDAGRVFDFHSLRCQLATLADQAGVSPRTVQRMMRHSTLALTDRYTRPRTADLERAADSIPTFRPSEVREQAARATGTEGKRAPISKTPYLLHSYFGDGNGRNPSDSDVLASRDVQPLTNEKPLVSKGFVASERVVSDAVASSGGGTRTPDTRIMIPLL